VCKRPRIFKLTVFFVSFRFFLTTGIVLGDMYCRSGQFTLACSVYQNAISKDSHATWAYRRLGEIQKVSDVVLHVF